MVTIAIVADDLTGALDTAARWAQFGLRTMVMLTTGPAAGHTGRGCPHGQPCAPRPNKPTAEQRKPRSACAAAAYTRRWTRPCVATSARRWRACWMGSDYRRHSLRPPFLPLGARCRGVSCASTECLWPRRSLAEIHSGLRGSRTCPPWWRGRLGARWRTFRWRWWHRAKRPSARHCRIALRELVVADAVEMEHLDALARAAAHMPQPWLCCGSAGLADGWLQALGFGQTAGEPLCWAPQAGPVLVVAGSRHPATARQLRQAQEVRGLHLAALRSKRVQTARSGPRLGAC